ncbi:pentatricopeptide repeat-containing protein At1g09900-like [Amborella trichopoda]|nr:pentatricopeptide repeat-containing protein At1g09900-like [Amborella trichopoda]XP_020529541.1 pentatricopeptide repeat-containing protein At1g09900-like [Amborella trichopoda]XP_020529542.1 pentatricopeptide repeat-containing protein At1g09900-like [Amborella trichopoda]XP_020529544.1 pentatricopeptide repeat-containing protein At1g09900-like [Amborella trichopoda]|eukprot:XP_006854920.2 pentatricopeptide repeat-containing protein At1g09900-like [Amborella trichopoda]
MCKQQLVRKLSATFPLFRVYHHFFNFSPPSKLFLVYSSPSYPSTQTIISVHFQWLDSRSLCSSRNKRNHLPQNPVSSSSYQRRSTHIPKSPNSSSPQNKQTHITNNPIFYRVHGRTHLPENRNSYSGHERRSTEHYYTQLMELVKCVEVGVMEEKLNHMNLKLSNKVVTDILRSTPNRGALMFFNWAKTRPGFNPNSTNYNLAISISGLLENFELMLLLMEGLSSKGHCLTVTAFSFLSRSPSIQNSVKEILSIIRRVGGPCLKSGVYYLISSLCDLNCFELAILVMEEMGKKTSYYNVLIAAKCRNGEFEEAKVALDEMKGLHYGINTGSFNYLLGSLCKKGRVAEACQLLEAMEDLGCYPDEITFEVMAYHACRMGKMDSALEFLNKMILEGLKPRFTTYAAFIKGYFFVGEVQNAHKFVLEMSEKDNCSANMNYSLLSSLLRKSGKIVEAHAILVEMIDKGLKPNFPVFIKVVKDLSHAGFREMGLDLKCRFSKFTGVSGVDDV